MATAPSPNDLTRQQLDELDSLLQRMLSLPLNPADGGTPTPPPATSWRVDPPAPAAAPAPHIAAPPLPPDPPVARAPVVAEPVRPPRPVPPPPSPPVATAGVFNPAPHHTSPPVATGGLEPTPPRFEPTSPFAEMTPTRPEPAAAREEESSPVPVALWPLVALNWTVDLLLGLFGPPGRFLRSGVGKYLLGLAGLALLIYTAAHVADEKGWLTPPFPVPWPR